MEKETQAGHPPTPSYNLNNQTSTWTERTVGGADTETSQEKKSGIPNIFKESVSEVGAVLRTKDKIYKEIFQNLQGCVLQYMVENYKK